MSMSSSDSEEFFDALNLLPKAKEPFLSLDFDKTASSIAMGYSEPNLAHHSASSSDPSMSFRNTAHCSLQQNHDDDCTTHRHKRLQNLRNKMLDEFERNPEMPNTSLVDFSNAFSINVSKNFNESSCNNEDVQSLDSWSKWLLAETRCPTNVLQTTRSGLLENQNFHEKPVTTDDKICILQQSCIEGDMTIPHCNVSEQTSNTSRQRLPFAETNVYTLPTLLGKSGTLENEDQIARSVGEFVETSFKNPNLQSTSAVDRPHPLVSSSQPVPVQHISSPSASTSGITSKNGTTGPLKPIGINDFLPLASPLGLSNIAKTCSLDRRPQVIFNNERRSGKSTSLTREFYGLTPASSACEHLLYGEAHLAAMERKTSAATEVIESLLTTSDLLNQSKSRFEKHREPTFRSSRLQSLNSSGKQLQSTSSQSSSTVDSTIGVLKFKALKYEPDIVTSHKVKETAIHVANDNVPILPSPPFRPPRRKKTMPPEASSSEAVKSALTQKTSGTSSFVDESKSQIVDSPSLTAEDKDFLRSIPLKNLDTGEQFPLDMLSEKFIDPLSLHMMRLNNDIQQRRSRSSLGSNSTSGFTDDVSSLYSTSSSKNYLIQAKMKTLQYKKMLGKSFGRAMNKTVQRMKDVADGVRYHFHADEGNQSEEDDGSDNSKMIRVRASNKHKGPYHFEQVRLAQNLTGEHAGSIWCLKFSYCGRLLATGGQDNIIRIWVLRGAYNYFNDMRNRYSADDIIPVYEQLQKCTAGMSISDESCRTSLNNFTATETGLFFQQNPGDMSSTTTTTNTSSSSATTTDESSAPFISKPFCMYRGHSADVLDLSWSKNYFVLSSSMDRTVRLWHISRTECLCCFQHIDFVTAIAFHPKDDRYFLSGSLDGKLRLWHIPEKKVALWNEVEGGKLVTTLTFARNGKFAVVGTYDGRCIFYTTDQLKYHTQIDVKSGHGKHSRTHKITGLEAFQDKLLVTSNDSRIRLYDLRDLSLTCKYKGYTNYSSQIRANFSHNGKFIVCGSENKNIYIWKTSMDSDMLSLPPVVRKDRNQMWESIRAHNAVVTAAVFSPRPDVIFQYMYNSSRKRHQSSTSVLAFKNSLSSQSGPFILSKTAVDQNVKRVFAGDVLVSADFNGALYIFINRAKIKTGSSTFLINY